ncbi:ImmA/IrrE family metallo-endopeptidase [Paenibacillus sp. FSL H7-0941]|uniref:ImmA/IrrE family metallo-endopeptidase n=1 Tax=Paenibacillus sp. FSL H7-0941 TaxID=2975351 RepID=UPI0030FB4451
MNSSFLAFPTSRKKIRSAVELLRNACGMDDAKYFPVIQFLEWALCRVDSEMNLEIRPKDSMSNRYGMFVPEKHSIILREDVYEGAIAGNVRDRFTVAHEIGHYFMHNSKTVAFARLDEKNTVPKSMDIEWQANVFAGEMLAPPAIVRNLSISEAVRDCGISKKTAEIQRKC